MADLKITDLPVLAGADLAATDPLAVADLSASATKKVTAKDFVQRAVTLIDAASIPVAKVDLSAGISGTGITNGSITATKLNTSTVPATGGVNVTGGNLQLVAPTAPIQLNASTGSLEHAVSGATAGTYTKVTVDAKGHVTAGTSIAATDLPVAVAGTVGAVSPGTGLSVTGGGVLNHTNTVTAATTSGFTYNAQGHITGVVALAGADLPVATSGVVGAVRPGTALSVDGSGILSVTAATSAALGGVVVGADFNVSTGVISLAVQGGLTPATYPKVTVNNKGIVTAGSSLTDVDIPNISAVKLTSGTLDISRIASNTVTGAKLANYAISKIGDTQPVADCTGQFFFNPLDKTLYLWDGNVFQPIGISTGTVIFAGTYNATTNTVASTTAAGLSIGLAVGGPLPSASGVNSSYYVVVSTGGTGAAPAPAEVLAPPDIILSNGTNWVQVDTSATITAQVASNVGFTPYGNIAAINVQAALQELDDEKLPLTGGRITGTLEIGPAGGLQFEGTSDNAYETTIAVVDPTADRTITLPNASGTVLLSGAVVNADIDASAGIVDTKLATISTAGKVSNSATTATNANTGNAIVARDASGNFSAGTITAALTGTASTATALATARNIQGVSFDGTANITVVTAGTGISVAGTAVANTGVLSVNGSTGAVTGIATLASPTFTGTVTIPAGASITGYAALASAQSFTAAQRGAITASGSVSGTVTLDFAVANNFSMTLPTGGTVTLATPSNITAGQSGCIVITQNGTTAATVAYSTAWKWQGGTPSISTTLSSVNVIAYFVESTTRITAQLLTNTVN